MRRLLLLLMFAAPVMAQTTSITALITDSDAQTWNNGTWSAVLISSGPPFINGVPVSPTSASGVMDSGGTITAVLADNSRISPAGSSWRFTICPNASGSCSTVSTAVAGASQNISAVLSAGITAPRFAAAFGAHGYLDVEVSPQPPAGGTYWNVTNLVTRVWTGSAWTTISGGGGGTGTVTSFGTSGYPGYLGTATVTSPTTTPNLVFTPNTSAAQNFFLAGPATGGAGALGLRAITAGDLPQGSSVAPGILQCGTGTTCAAGVISAATGTVTSVSGTANQIDVSGTTAPIISFDPKALNSLYGGGVFFVQAYFSAGATVDTWVQACVAAALAVGGICDTTALSGQTLTWAFNKQLSVGNASNNNVALRLPCFGQWNFNLNGGTADMVSQFPNTAIYDDCGTESSGFNFKNTSAPNGANYGYRTVPSTTGNANVWYYAYGFAVVDVTPGFNSGIEALVNAGVDSSYFGHLYFLDSSTTDTHILEISAVSNGQKVCCSTVFDHDYAEAAQTGPNPLFINGFVTNATPISINILGGSYQHPKAGQSNIVCTDTNTTGLTTVTFDQDVYLELNNADVSSPPVIQIGGCAMVVFNTLTVTSEVLNTTRQVVNISNAFNTNFGVRNMHLRNGGGSWTLPNTQAIVNANGSTIPTNSHGDLAGYNSLTTYTEASATGKLTVTGTGIPISSGTTSNNDLDGRLTLVSGTITRNFTATYTTAPVCVATDTTSVAAVQASTSTTVLTLNGTGTDVIAYHCIGLQ